jgi:hypothetical protein
MLQLRPGPPPPPKHHTHTHTAYTFGIHSLAKQGFDQDCILACLAVKLAVASFAVPGLCSLVTSHWNRVTLPRNAASRSMRCMLACHARTFLAGERPSLKLGCSLPACLPKWCFAAPVSLTAMHLHISLCPTRQVGHDRTQAGTSYAVRMPVGKLVVCRLLPSYMLATARGVLVRFGIRATG